MAQAIKTVLTYNLDGATKDFNIPFEYLARKFVVVTLIGVDRKTLILNQDYRFATRTTISTTLAWGPATGYQQIEIRRYTSATERLVDFTDGSILRAYDLNVAQVQTLHVAEEARDLTADTIGVNNDGNLDARGRRIVNLADAVLDSDAISLGQVKRMNENSWQARNEALQFRNEAEAFKNASDTNASNTLHWRNEAEGFKVNANVFRNEAENFKNMAAASQGAAAGSAQSAANSQGAAATSEANALAQANRATSEADRAKNEADKLGNWNALGAAIMKVEGNNVYWKGSAFFNYGVRSYLPSDPTRFMEFNCHGTSGDPSGEIVMNWTAGRNVLINWNHNGNDPIGAYRHHINVEASKNLRINGGRAFLFRNGEGWSHQGNVNTEIYTTVTAGDQTGQGGWVANTRYRWYNSGVEFGIVRGGGTNTEYALWRLKPSSDSAAYKDVSLFPDGSLRASGDVFAGGGGRLQQDGRVWGSAYGNTFIDDWMRANWAYGCNITDIVQVAVWRSPGVSAGASRIIVGAINSNSDDHMDLVQYATIWNRYHNGNATHLY